MPQPSPDDDYFVCPHCGAVLPVDATFCRSCGSSEEMGWDPEGEDGASYTHEDDFDYDEYVSREHGSQWGVKQALIALVIILICAAIFLSQIGW